jgi:hypothetical protein
MCGHPQNGTDEPLPHVFQAIAAELHTVLGMLFREVLQSTLHASG